MRTVRAHFNSVGGIHPRYEKAATANLPIEIMPVPKTLFVSMAQHLGVPSKPMVKKGDKVLKGQPIAEPGGYVSSSVHAPSSGDVKSVGPMPTASGRTATVVVIETDGSDKAIEFQRPADWSTLSAKELVELVAKGGIVGMGGAGFPTHVKLSPPEGKKIDTLILNGAECEPYLTADDRVMVEQGENIWAGAQIIRKILGARQVRIAIEDNKPDAIAAMERVLRNADGDVEIVVLKTEYPQGAEKQLIYSVTGREVPSGGLPLNVGALVENVGTAVAISDAIIRGMPLIQRVTTVTGRPVKSPKNVMNRVGTSFADLVAFCGGFTEEPGKVLCGGPMMGVAQATPDAAVTKTTSGLLALSGPQIACFTSMPCIGCGRCVLACPMRMLPCTLSEYLEAQDYAAAEEFNVMDCIECGACAYVCPAHRPLVQHMRQGKTKVTSIRKQREAAAAARALKATS